MEPAGIGPRQSGVQRQADRLAPGAFDDGRDHVALGKIHVCSVVVRAFFPQQIFVQPRGLGRH